MTFIFKPSARSATIEPTLPQPMMPSVLPKISTPRNLFFSHLPARVELSASGICRAKASISEIACSAVVIELPNGVFITMMPRAVAAAISTLSTPMPARPITFRLLACSRSFPVTLVAERIANPSKPLIVAASLSLCLPRPGANSTSRPRSLKIATAAGDSASEISTLGAISFVLLKSVLDVTSRRRGKRRLGLGIGPVEPQRQRFDIGALHGRAAPNAQARRRVAVGVDVIGDTFFFERRGNALDELSLGVDGKPAHGRIDDFQAHRCIRAQC